MNIQIPASESAVSVARRRSGSSVLSWALAGLILVALPFRILHYGYLPSDDALRHAAKAVSGKPWSEILLLRPEITIDHNQGWQWVLTSLHHLTDWDARTLVVFSVITMFVIFAASPLPWLRRPEAWLTSLALVMMVFPYFAARVFLGRPLLLTMAATLMLLSMWTRSAPGRVSRMTILFTILLVAMAAWMNGTWYLLLLLPAVFFLAQAWRKGLILLFCWLIGTLLAALLTGNPWTFLKQTALIPVLALGLNVPANSLVRELQPFNGSYPAVILAAVVLIGRKLTGRPLSTIPRDPVFWLALVGWLLGFRVVRFWLDWGIPALALWLARQFEESLEAKMTGNSWGGAGVDCLAAAVLFLVVGSDRNARWSQYGDFDCLDARRPEHAEWVPGPGGILYSLDLSVFYETFFRNPRGNWRYVMGFEPSFMRPEDLAVYQDLCRTHNAIRACAPWVKRMTPADRFVLLGAPQTRPAFPQLEWYYAVNNTWVGRLPRNAVTPLLPPAHSTQ